MTEAMAIDSTEVRQPLDAEKSPPLGNGTEAIPMEPPWWSGAVVDSISGFSAMLAFILGGIILLRKWQRRRRPLHELDNGPVP